MRCYQVWDYAFLKRCRSLLFFYPFSIFSLRSIKKATIIDGKRTGIHIDDLALLDLDWPSAFFSLNLFLILVRMDGIGRRDLDNIICR